MRRGEKECEAFKEMMVEKLEQRGYRGPWKDLPMFVAWENLQEEMRELIVSVNDHDAKLIIQEAIDVANSCMILVDVLGGIKK